MYKLNTKGNAMLFDILSTVMANRGIENKEKFLKLSASDTIHYNKLKNIDKAVKMFKKHKENKSDITVLVDSDPDGFTSASMLVGYTRKHHPEIKVNYLIHETRAHGLTPSIMKQILASNST